MGNKKINLTYIFLPLLLLAMVAVVFVTSNKQGGGFDVRKRATTTVGTAEMMLVPTTGNTYYVGDTFSFDVMLNTHEASISGLAMRLYYPFTTSVPEIQVVDQDATRDGTQIQSFVTDLGFSTKTNLVYNQPATNGNAFIDFAAITTATEGYSTGQESKKIATITFKANRVTPAAGINIDHVNTETKVTRKSDGLDDLLPIETRTIKVLTENQAPTVTITGGPEHNSSTPSSTITFNWTGSDNPTRPANANATITYSYHFNNEGWSALSSATTITRNLPHGTHTFEVRAKDSFNVYSTTSAPASKRTFTINLAPTLTSVEPNHGPAGTQVTLNGAGFGSIKKNVYFGATLVPAANITNWTDNQITLTSPNAGGDVKVSLAGNVNSNVKPFTLETMLKVYFSIQGITQNRGSRTVTVAVKRPNTSYLQKYTVTATWSAPDVSFIALAGPLPMPFTTTNYSVSVHEANHLRKKFVNVPLVSGTLNVLVKKAAADQLLTADFTGDNKLTIDDFSKMMTQYNAATNAVTDANKIYDLNGDGSITIDDIALLLTNYTALIKSGDDE